MKDIPFTPGACLGAALGYSVTQALRGCSTFDMPLVICKVMQVSDNPEIKSFGYRMETALLRQKKKSEGSEEKC